MYGTAAGGRRKLHSGSPAAALRTHRQRVHADWENSSGWFHNGGAARRLSARETQQCGALLQGACKRCPAGLGSSVRSRGIENEGLRQTTPGLFHPQFSGGR